MGKSNMADFDELAVLPDAGYDIIGAIAALSVPILSAYLVILTRQCREAHCSVLVSWYGLGGLVISLVGLFTLGDPHLFHDTQEWILVVAIALLGILGNVFMTLALKWLKPGQAMVMRSFEMVAAYFFQVVVFQNSPVWLAVGGAGLILLAVLLMALEDSLRQKVTWKFL